MLATGGAMGLEREAGTGSSAQVGASAHRLSFAPALPEQNAHASTSPAATAPASGYAPPTTATRLGKRVASPVQTSLSNLTERCGVQQGVR